MPGNLDAGTSRELLVIGVNHRSARSDLGERFALIEAELDAMLDALRERGLADGVLLATCDRVELVSSDPRSLEFFAPLLAARLGVAPETIEAALFRRAGDAAMRHLFAVASALDSRVIGEPQVLGQLKAAHRAAAEQGLVGGTIEDALEAAYAAARRVRRETRIAQGPVSLATAALALARDIHGDLADRAALLMGPSELGALMAGQFRRAGLRRLIVCGPPARAARAARDLDAELADLDAVENALGACDIVISSLGIGRTVMTRALVAAALRKRPLKPIFVIDAAIPADAEPAINDLDGAFLYDLADLERTALAGRAEREAAAAAGWAIIDRELAAFAERAASRRAVPALVALRRRIERLREEALAEGGDVETVTRRLVNRLLHDPSEELRQLAGEEADVATSERLLRRLFRLGSEDERTK
ncbi:MAG TPA: glutamyl-tRNA reductase [Stellaceae bacterium]|nr:glutamyl-tRNA reductase [Stellaceae bacterium]